MTNRLMLFRGKKISVYCENHMEHTNIFWGQNSEILYVKTGGTYSDQWVLISYYAIFFIFPTSNNGDTFGIFL
jgi:hypothetical protein